MSLTTGFGNHFTKILLEWLLGGTATGSAVATWRPALFTTDPTDDDGSTLVEVNTSQYVGYARPSFTNNTTNFPASSTVSHVQTLVTGTDITWGVLGVGSAGCTIVGVGLYDAGSGGNLGPWGPLTLSRAVVEGDEFKIPAGNLTFTMS